MNEEPLERCIAQRLSQYAQLYIMALKEKAEGQRKAYQREKGMFNYLDIMAEKGYDKTKMFRYYMKKRDEKEGIKWSKW